MELAMLFLDLMHHIHMLVRCTQWTGGGVCDVQFSLHPIFHFSCLFFFLLSYLATYGCPWRAWLSSCSCGISSMRSSAAFAGTRTTFVSSTTWKPGDTVFWFNASFPVVFQFCPKLPGTDHCFKEVLMCWLFHHYLCILQTVLCRFSVATSEELAANDDDCAICWDTMLTARKLPCGHLFHK